MLTQISSSDSRRSEALNNRRHPKPRSGTFLQKITSEIRRSAALDLEISSATNTACHPNGLNLSIAVSSRAK
jgi:hypothetical protein